MKLHGTGIVEFVHGRLKEIKGLFGVLKDDSTEQRLILDPRREECHFVEPEYPEHPHLGLVMQSKTCEKREAVCKLARYLQCLPPVASARAFVHVL